MNAPTIRRTLVHLRDESGKTVLTLDELMDGRVRLRGFPETPDLHAETIEDLLVDAAASRLNGELYAALLWELDLLALRGDRGWPPG
ncbi:hypothetical protein [Deinococcus frigens]|uniref:hypothetical protein n=1 Tax=Deinococcus frigens TaxID=249403 RepID=UPI00049560DB|nr:hypothetical protein [Deinococcus frigens]